LIMEAGYRYVSIASCEWERLKRMDKEVRYFLYSTKMGDIDLGPMSEKEIEEKILSEELFGFVLCNVKVPEEKRKRFECFPAIFKKAKIGLMDIPEPMRTYVLKHNIFTPNSKQLRELLISSFHAENVLLSTTYLRWLLENDHVVYDIKAVLQFQGGRAPFKKFIEACTSERKVASDNGQQVLKAFWKTLPNTL